LFLNEIQAEPNSIEKQPGIFAKRVCWVKKLPDNIILKKLVA